MRIYLDHNATTAPAPEVLELTGRVAREIWGNASSIHHFGQPAKAVLDEARGRVAELIGAEPAEITFTGGGTESDNAAIRGLAEALEPTGRRHLVTTAIEHEAVLNTVKALARRGWSVSCVPVDASGIVAVDDVAAALTDDTALVSVMHANNEIGTIQPIADIASAVHARGALLHTDAVQTVGKIPVDVNELGVDLLSLSAHKFYGPKGVGALWVRRGVRLQPFVTGGKQERGRRAGTENVAGIAGLGMASSLARAALAREGQRVALLRDRLEHGILSAIPGSARRPPRPRCTA